MTGEWIEWKGGKCPVAPRTLVEIKCRNGGTNGDMEARFWDGPGAPSWWEHASRDHANDIIAYRIVEQRDEQ